MGGWVGTLKFIIDNISHVRVLQGLGGEFLVEIGVAGQDCGYMRVWRVYKEMWWSGRGRGVKWGGIFCLFE